MDLKDELIENSNIKCYWNRLIVDNYHVEHFDEESYCEYEMTIHLRYSEHTIKGEVEYWLLETDNIGSTHFESTEDEVSEAVKEYVISLHLR